MIDVKMQLFDSRNTCRTIVGSYKNYSELKKDASRMSMQYHHLTVLDDNGLFETFEKGEMTEWSYPNGLGMIKINS